MIQVTPSSIGKVLSAIEMDLRTLIALQLTGQKRHQELFGQELYEKCLERQQKDSGSSTGELQDLLLYADFADLYHILNAQKDLLPQPLVRHLKMVTPFLDALVPVRNRVAHNRPLYYDDCLKADEFIQHLLPEFDIFWKHVKNEFTALKNSEGIKKTNIMHNLPIPDFEETGFIGRRKQSNDLKRLCFQSPYPVITIIGDGGVGKSALALKAAYDISEASDCPFDAIVWTTSKTTQLTPHEIKTIEKAIRTSLDLFQDISASLGPSKVDDPLSEVLDYLQTFKILLILDNLETILDDQIRQFLGNLPAGGSKVLITSRIGVGAYEVPFQLQPLDENEAIQLLRALTDIRQIGKLAQMPNKQLGEFCKKMKNNPLFIKWFVSAVQTGKRPEEVLEQRDLFLEFCMSNVYNYLSSESQRVLNSMLCIPGQWSQAELAFLNEMDAMTLEKAIRQLRTTTMLTISSNVRDVSFESKYDLSGLARDYLSKHHPVRFEEEKMLKKRHRRLVAIHEDVRGEQNDDPYSPYHIAKRSSSDTIVATYLRPALHRAKSRLFQDAEEYIAKARSLAPEYFEVYRVEAFIKALQDNYSAARTAYEAAVELNPTSAPLRYWYAGFLLRYQNELEAALKEFQEAARLDPTSIDIQMEIARTCLFLRRFGEARTLLDHLLLQISHMKAVLRRKVYDLHFQYYTRRADSLVYQRDLRGAFQEIEALQKAYQACPPEFIDDKVKRTLGKIGPIIHTCASAMPKTEEERVNGLLAWFDREIRPQNEHEDVKDVQKRLKGVIVRLVSGRNFGFIQDDDRREYFFRRHMMADPHQWEKLHEGSVVFFWDGGFMEGRHPKATSITLDDSR